MIFLSFIKKCCCQKKNVRKKNHQKLNIERKKKTERVLFNFDQKKKIIVCVLDGIVLVRIHFAIFLYCVTKPNCKEKKTET